MKYFISLFTLIIILLTSCSPATILPIPTDVILATATTTPPPTATPQPTNTPKPTATATLIGQSEVISNVGAPTNTEVETILTDEAEIEFPESLTTSYEDENFAFDFRLSKDLVRYSGIDQFQMPDEMAKKWAYQALGEVFYGLSGKNEEFQDFKTLSVGGNFFQDKVESAVDDGILNNDISIQDIEGRFSSLAVDLVTKQEFNDLAVKLQEQGIKFTWRLYKDSPNYNWNFDTDVIVFLTEEGTLRIIIYNNGINNSERNSPNYPPLYYQQPGRTNEDYLRSIDFDYERGMMIFRALAEQGLGDKYQQLITMQSVCPEPDEGQSPQEACDIAFKTAFGK